MALILALSLRKPMTKFFCSADISLADSLDCLLAACWLAYWLLAGLLADLLADLLACWLLADLLLTYC